MRDHRCFPCQQPVTRRPDGTWTHDNPRAKRHDAAIEVRCLPCRNGNHTGTNGTPGCAGDFCRCPCRGEQ